MLVLVLGSYQALPIQSLDGGHNREKDSNSQNEETSGGEDFGYLSRATRAEPPLNGLKAGSSGAARLSSAEVLALLNRKMSKLPREAQAPPLQGSSQPGNAHGGALLRLPKPKINALS